MVEIIIVKYNAPEFEADCIKNVIDNTHIPYHLTVYDNYPTDHSLSRLWNYLIRRSDAKYICLLNSDAFIGPDAIELMIKRLEETGAGIVGPVSNNAGPRQTMARGEGYEETDMLSGFCLVFKKDVWKKVNGFDENYHLYFEDDDFSEKVKGQGLKLVIDREVFIKHVQRGSANKRSDTNKYFDQSRKYFEFKWGRRWRP